MKKPFVLASFLLASTCLLAQNDPIPTAIRLPNAVNGSWLDAVGTAIAVQQKLMRHSDIRTTMNIYGDVVTDEMERAQSKVGALVLNRGSMPN